MEAAAGVFPRLDDETSRIVLSYLSLACLEDRFDICAIGSLTVVQSSHSVGSYRWFGCVGGSDARWLGSSSHTGARTR